MNKQRRRIRLFFLNCPRLDWKACSYLLLAQNKNQTVFEFEIYHYWAYVALTQKPFSWITRAFGYLGEKALVFRYLFLRKYAARLDRKLAPSLRSTLPLNKITGTFSEALKKHDEWLMQLRPSYGGGGIEHAPSIVITETPFFGDYYGWSEGDLAVISVANWKRRFAPPSVFEYVLTNVQRYSLRLAFGPEVGSHYPTRACIWDFNAALEDIGTGILVGYLCSNCESTLATQIDDQELQEVKRLLSNKWVGRVDDPGSVARNLKTVFGYDMARTKGLSRGLRDRALEAATSEVIKWLVPFSLGALVVWFLSR